MVKGNLKQQTFLDKKVNLHISVYLLSFQQSLTFQRVDAVLTMDYLLSMRLLMTILSYLAKRKEKGNT